MEKKSLDIVVVSCKTPELVEIVIKSFQKFSTNFFDLRFIIVENSEYDLISYVEKKGLKNVVIINNPISATLSEAHGSGLEASKSAVLSEYVFTCHSDTCVTSNSFFDELKRCINDEVVLAGVCEDKHPDRIKALHCSGLLVRSDIFKSVSMRPILPRIDTADLLTEHCRNNKLKMHLFPNTYNDDNLVDLCNSPFKELGKDCGIDRCLDSTNNVMFMHQGRGTTKYSNLYTNPKKISTEQWMKICNKIIEN